MSNIVWKKLLVFFFVCALLEFVTTRHAFAASLTSVSDTLSNARPSASSVLTADQAAAATTISLSDNNSLWFASDSAKFFADPGGGGETTDASIIVATQSAVAAGARTVYFTGGITHKHHNGDPVLVAQTALHTIKFTVPSGIPSSGKIVITFPALTTGDSTNSSSASASTFQLNNLADAQVKLFDNSSAVTYTSTYVNANSNGTASKITLASLSSSFAAGDVVTLYLGCSAATSGSCSTQVPLIINPTASNTNGNADTWKVAIQTQDSSGNPVDSSNAYVGTINSVFVQAAVDSTFTFTIAGIAGGVNAKTGNTTGCTNADTTGATLNSTPTIVNLGSLSSAGTIAIAAQLLTVTTNAINGYSLTATSSGHLINPANGFYLADSTTPAVFPTTGPWFGIHACGHDVTTGTWGGPATTIDRNANGSSAKVGWPTTTTSLTLASATSGPIANSITAGSGLTTVEYAAGIDASVPAGTYTSYITYIATPTF